MPFHPEHFLETGRALRKKGLPARQRSYESHFYEALPLSQREHYRDWISMNGVSHDFRTHGLAAFFSYKIVILDHLLVSLQIHKVYLDSLVHYSYEDPRRPSHNLLFAHARHILTALVFEDFMDGFPAYHTFPRLHSVSILPCSCGVDARALLNLGTAVEHLRPGKLCEGGISSRSEDEGMLRWHSAPRKMIALLEDVGFPIKEVNVELIYDGREVSKGCVNRGLADWFYPLLRCLAERRKLSMQAQAASNSELETFMADG